MFAVGEKNVVFLFGEKFYIKKADRFFTEVYQIVALIIGYFNYLRFISGKDVVLFGGAGNESIFRCIMCNCRCEALAISFKPIVFLGGIIKKTGTELRGYDLFSAASVCFAFTRESVFSARSEKFTGLVGNLKYKSCFTGML